MTNIEMYTILVNTFNTDNFILSHFLKIKIKKQILENIETSITRLFKKREYFRISGDNIKAKQIDEALDLLFEFRNEVKKI